MKRITVVLLVLSTVLFANSEKIKLNFNETDFNFTTTKDGVVILSKSPNIFSYGQEGVPYLPVMPISVLVPDGAELETVIDIADAKRTMINDEVMVSPVPVPTDGSEEGKLSEKNPEIYNKNSLYPEKSTIFTGSHKMGGYRFFTFLVYPYRYNPVTNELVFSNNLELDINYSLNGKAVKARPESPVVNQMISNLVINKDKMDSYKKTFTSRTNDDIELLIITSEKLKSSFIQLANYRMSTGVISKVVTVEDIYANYSGQTDQLKIKSCIEDYYQNEGTEFVILGGDMTEVPDQDAYGKVGSYTDEHMPTDLFYSCFDNDYDWNADGDNVVGEINDNIDMAPEVIITRIPVRTSDEVIAYINKVSDYEKNPPTENFAEEMILCGLELWNTWDDRSDADWRSEYMFDTYIDPVWNGERFRLYDTNTDFGGAGYNCNATNVSEQINNGYNYFFMATHGNQQIWGMEGGGNYGSFAALNQTNAGRQGIVTTIACITNAFDMSSGYGSDPCLSEGFIRNPNGGAIGYIGSSRYGWGNSWTVVDLGSSFQFIAKFYNLLFTGEPTGQPYLFGTVAAEHKIQMLAFSNQYGTYRWSQFTHNNIGDPFINLYTEDPTPIEISTTETFDISNPQPVIIETNAPNAKVCLSKGEDYYFATTADASGNVTVTPTPNYSGEIVVTVSAHNKITTTSTIQVTGDNSSPFNISNNQISLTIDPDIEESSTITVSNSGSDSYSFSTDITIDGYNPGSVIEDYNYENLTGYSNLFGIAYDGENLWVTSQGQNSLYDDNYVLKLDINGNLLAEYLQPTTSFSGIADLCYDGEFLYGGDKDGFYKINPQDGTITTLFTDLPGDLPTITAVTYVPNLGFVTYKQNDHFVVFNESGELLDTLELEEDIVTVYGLGYSERDNLLYLFVKEGQPRTTVLVYDIETQTLKENRYQLDYLNGLTSQFACGGFYSETFVPGKKSFVGIVNGNDDKMFIMDAGDLWIEFEEDDYVLAPSESVEIEVNFNSSGLYEGGTKTAEITLKNGFNNVVVPITLNVNSTGIDEEIVANTTTLHGNYPNPFNPETTISFTLKNQADVKLYLYDVSGSLVNSYKLGVVSQGRNTYKLNGMGLASGVYLYRLSVGNNLTGIKKMVLLK